MDAGWICVTCGVQYPPAPAPPVHCPICEDDRQYVGLNGQEWTTLDERRASHRNEIGAEEEDVWWMRTVPAFAIGQRAFLVRTDEGNLLWDCVSLVDADTVAWVERQGGIRAIAVSHPHYYSTMVEWSLAFGNCPVWIHEDDRQWVVRAADPVTCWTGETRALFGDLRLVRCGGHFAGYQVLHWPRGCSGRGVLFAGDQPQVCMDRRRVTFMYSYPNWIPFDAGTVNAITRVLDPLPFDRLYGAFGRHLLQDAKATIARSRERYLAAIGASGASREPA
jgi:glyoxylase-like metal-dependent hydrolase (beta-lactamase superfamily II)